MAKKIINVPQETVTKIQALQYECESRKGLLAFMLDKGGSVESEGFRAYHREYTDFNARYEQAKEDMQKTVLEPQVPGRLLTWKLDFASGEAECEYEPMPVFDGCPCGHTGPVGAPGASGPSDHDACRASSAADSAKVVATA